MERIKEDCSRGVLCVLLFKACLNSFKSSVSCNNALYRALKPHFKDDLNGEHTRTKIYIHEVRKGRKGAKNFPLGIGYRDTIIINMEVASMRVYAHRTR